MHYDRDESLEAVVRDIVAKLGMDYIDLSRLFCMRSRGTSTRRTLARIHTIPRIMQKAVGVKPHYVIEVLSENFDRLSPEDKTRTLIHELMHIPSAFSGGFRQHNIHVTRSGVERLYRDYVRACCRGF